MKKERKFRTVEVSLKEGCFAPRDYAGLDKSPRWKLKAIRPRESCLMYFVITLKAISVIFSY